ncbi:14793_t:CDS:2 [Funneliformis mosseae]|uniref:14793_t:CDS:1 n=1 Tax=Funneliformis mosseae TaxID=27381 RepID=A0A9N8WMG5_FUNMO|nr:14793_t:CDS:2 [Funneliformis mosseae]
MESILPPENRPNLDVPAEMETTSQQQQIAYKESEEFSATKIANAWRNHRKTREEEGKILSANSRDNILKSGTSCLHLPGQTCPVWSQWEELLNAVEAHLRRKEILQEPPSSNQKFELAMTVVERIAKGSSSVKNHLWLILDTEHWLEICDEEHRYGSNLKVYHDYWLKTSTPENFFEWLDKGEGKHLNLEARPRELLDHQKVRYLTRKERREFEVTFRDGMLIYEKSGKPVHTNPTDQLPSDPDSANPNIAVGTRSLSIPNPTRTPSPAPSSQGSLNLEIEDPEEQITPHTRQGSTGSTGMKHEKWIYVTDCDGNFYVGQKIKGHFHHSSFLAGGAICAAGGIKVREGKLLEINPNSGHYKPAQHHFKALIERLINEGIYIDDAKVTYPNDILEKRIMAKYKFKRLALLSMVYDEFMRDAGKAINQQLDTMDRHVTRVSTHLKRNMSEAVKAGKESIKEWLQQVMPVETNKKEDRISDNDLLVH